MHASYKNPKNIKSLISEGINIFWVRSNVCNHRPNVSHSNFQLKHPRALKR